MAKKKKKKRSRILPERHRATASHPRRPKKAQKIAEGYLHPYAEAHKPGRKWPANVKARVVNFAMFNSVEAAERKYTGIPQETIAIWVIDAAKPTPERIAGDKGRLQEIRLTCEKVIYLQAKRVLKRLQRKADAGEEITDQDRAWVAERLAKALAMLGATAQRWHIADTTEDVREARRVEDEELRAWEKKNAPVRRVKRKRP